jgi:light-regulated signal transduction histidine kinase (bacteriophytochrome)
MSQQPTWLKDVDNSLGDGGVKQSSPAWKDCPKAWDSPPSNASKARQKSPPQINYSISSPSDEGMNQLSPGATDRVFPIRSVVSVDPTPTLSQRPDWQGDYFYHCSARASEARRQSVSSDTSHTSQGSKKATLHQKCQDDAGLTPRPEHPLAQAGQDARRGSIKPSRGDSSKQPPPRLPAQLFSDIISYRSGESENTSRTASLLVDDRPPSTGPSSSVKSNKSSLGEAGGLLTARFKHVISDGGHAVITGRDGDVLQRCEDEPIHIPGAVQGFGLLIALQEDCENCSILPVRIVSENSRRIIGRSPKELFALESFTDILSEEQTDNLLDHIDFIRDEDADVATNGPEVFTMSIKTPSGRSRKLWCAMHMNDRNPGLLICEFELEDDPANPLVPPSDLTPELPQDTLNSQPTAEEYAESTEAKSRPLRILRNARKRKGEAAAMEVFNIMSQVQEQLAAAQNLERFLQVLVGVVKELTGFHRVMIYQFDQAWNGRVVTELVDPRATKDLYKGLNFPASDIPKQARELYKLNRVRMLYDRDQETARLVCRTVEDLETPLDLTYSYLRAMSPIHLKYLANMAVRSSMSISINAFGELWGLISCHSYGPRGMRVSFPIRKMCRLVGDSASRNIERLSYASRLQARKLINTVPTQHNPSGYIIASSDDLLKLFDADFGLLSIRDETKILGDLEQSQEALAMLEYLRMRKITSVMTSRDVTQDFPDLRYPPGFQVIVGMLVVPLSFGGSDFIVFFRKGQLKEVKWAGNPYEKLIKEGTEGYLEPRKSFKTWSETVMGNSREWTEEEIETAAVLCLVYGKFIEVWRQKEAALQSSQLTKLLLANSAHEIRTPLNAIINYLEIALEGSLDQETRENLAKSHSASKSLIYVINDLLDLTKTEEGGELIKGEEFDLKVTFREATDMFTGDTRRKGIIYEVTEHPGVPKNVIGDQRKVRQAISNITANAIQNTLEGSVKVEMYVIAWQNDHVDVEVAVQDTGIGMNTKQLDLLFRDLEQVQSESTSMLEDTIAPESKALSEGKEVKGALGLGLAVVARTILNMNGQLRLKSEESRGSRFVIQLPFDLPDSEIKHTPAVSPEGSLTPQPDGSQQGDGEVTLVERDMTRTDFSSGTISRKESADSLNSKYSIRSFKSGSSNRSGRSDAGRSIEVIQEAYLVEKRPKSGGRSNSMRSSRPRLEKQNSYGKSLPAAPKRIRPRSLDLTAKPTVPPHQRSMIPGEPGEEILLYSVAPVRVVKIPDEVGSPINEHPPSSSGILGEVNDNADADMEPPSADHMHILVAEDDPVNSRILKKRLEKIGHETYLTINGEECASAFGDQPEIFDVVLMDMQVSATSGSTKNSPPNSTHLPSYRCPSSTASHPPK